MDRLRSLWATAQRWIEAAEARPLAFPLLAIGLAAGVSAAMATVAGVHAVVRVLGHLDLAWLALAPAGRAIADLGYTAAHRRVSAMHGGPELPPRIAFEAVAYGGSATSLRGGFAIDRRALMAAGASPEHASVRVLGLAALEYAVLAPAAWISALLLLTSRHVQASVTVPWAVCVPVGFAIAAVIALREARRHGTAEQDVRSHRGRLRAALALLRDQVAHPLRNWAAWAGMAAYWAGEVVSLWVALRATGLHPDAPVAILGFATGYAFSPRSMPLAGVALTEALMPVAFGWWMGLPLAASVVAVFLYRVERLILSLPVALLVRPRLLRRLAGAS